jgi:hypothetical protein
MRLVDITEIETRKLSHKEMMSASSVIEAILKRDIELPHDDSKRIWLPEVAFITMDYWLRYKRALLILPKEYSELLYGNITNANKAMESSNGWIPNIRHRGFIGRMLSDEEIILISAKKLCLRQEKGCQIGYFEITPPYNLDSRPEQKRLLEYILGQGKVEDTLSGLGRGDINAFRFRMVMPYNPTDSFAQKVIAEKWRLSPCVLYVNNGVLCFDTTSTRIEQGYCFAQDVIK